MSLVGFGAKNHPQQVGRRGARPEIDDRATPPEVFDALHERFRFTVDACALPHNAKLPRYWTPEQDGLRQSWAAERVWCNPPFSDIGRWVRKASSETFAECVVMLVPANRTEQAWWHEYVEPWRDGRLAPSEWPLRVEFLRGRTRFIRVGADGVGANERPPFGCCLLIWQQYPRGRPGPQLFEDDNATSDS
jgi:phage N-6-adenine-methyltransferase